MGLVLTLNRITLLLSLVAVPLAAAYPFMKRFTYLPQVHLGFAFGWAVPMAFAAETGSVPPVAWLILTGVVLWAVAYDTMYARVLPDARVRFVCQEFGTLDSVRVLKALREENRWAHYGDGGVAHPTKLDLKEAFGPADLGWRNTVLKRGAVVIGQALTLAGPD